MSEAPPDTGLVLRVLAGTYRVELEGELLECILGGRLKRGAEAGVVVGDRVELERLPDGACRIVGLLPRRSKLARRSVARRREQVIAANLDQLAAVSSVDRPEPDFTMLDRLLVLAELNGLEAIVILNKADLDRGDREAGRGGPAEDAIPENFLRYRELGYDVLPTSAEESAGLAALRQRLAGRTTVFAGPSGAGKSSLLNALIPSLDLRVESVGERSGRGRHTTVNASLHPLPDGGYAGDTPGLQYLALWSLSAADLSFAFREFRPWLSACRFNDCRHVSEPACGVREALQRGRVSRRRYESYRTLLEEVGEERR